MFGGGNGSLAIVVENKSPRRRSADEAEKNEDFRDIENGEEIAFEQGDRDQCISST